VLAERVSADPVRENATSNASDTDELA